LTPGGGPQSSSSSNLNNRARLIVTPNPFSKYLDIYYQIPDKSQKILLKIYNATGRLVKTFSKFPCNTSNSSLSLVWDGTDDNGQQLPEGIYFIHLKTLDKEITKKAVLLR
jgi:flagellar hook assembly protein FlgD